MPTYLHGLSLKNYRGIGSNPQRAAPLKACNFFIGANNTGKSIFLNFISLHLNHIVDGGRKVLEFAPWEAHIGSHASEIEVGFAVSANVLTAACAKGIAALHGNSFSLDVITRIIRSLSRTDDVWIQINPSSVDKRYFLDAGKIETLASEHEISHLWHVLNPNSSGGNKDSTWIPGVLNWMLGLIPFKLPRAYIIPAMRRIGEKGGSFDDYSGKGLIARLAELQNPGSGNRDLNVKFQKINGFLQEVTSDPNIRIEVTFDQSELLVHKDGRVLPLSSLGTGIHEVVMIAAFCTLITESIVCVEEPEVHLHPLLQKKLLRYLTERTSNQYFIATHSASIIDQDGAAVFHVTHQGATTNIELTSTPMQRLKVCQDLGYRASDLLQTNFIVWVEGPTDRIYLNHWLSAVAEDLREGIHYSVMFYGGRLLSHLSADDIEITDFIALRRLNQNVAILIDSDMEHIRSPVNATKKRIASEFDSTGHLAWITAGREIENYVSPDVLSDVLRKLYPTFKSVVSVDRFDHRLKFYQSGSRKEKIREADKVKVARAVCALPANLGILDLNKKIDILISQIRSANP